MTERKRQHRTRVRTPGVTRQKRPCAWRCACKAEWAGALDPDAMSAAERTKDRSNLLQHWEGRVLGLSSATSRKVLSDRPALKPDWGKPAVRNFREEDGNS